MSSKNQKTITAVVGFGSVVVFLASIFVLLYRIDLLLGLAWLSLISAAICVHITNQE